MATIWTPPGLATPRWRVRRLWLVGAYGLSLGDLIVLICFFLILVLGYFIFFWTWKGSPLLIKLRQIIGDQNSSTSWDAVHNRTFTRIQTRP